MKDPTTMKRLIAASSLGASLLVACGGQEAAPAGSAASSASGATSASASAPAAKTAVPPAAKPIELDAETVKLAKAAAEKCKTYDATEEVDGCPAGEYEAIGKYAQDKKPKHFHVTLAEMALTDGAKDKTLYAVAFSALGSFADAGGRDWLKDGATPEAAERTLKLLAGAPEGYGWTVNMAAKVPLAAGKIDETVTALKGSKAKLKSAYSLLIAYGGIGALPAARAVAKDASLDPEVRANAVRAVSRAVDPGIFRNEAVLAASDKTQACDWAKEMASDTTPQIANAAADALSDCEGAYIDAALTALAPRVDAEKPTNQLIASVLHQCWGHAVVGRPPNGSQEQCKKAIELVDKLSTKEGLAPGDASWIAIVAGGIGRDCGDCKPKAKEILGRIKGHKEKYVADTATKELDKLK